VVITLVRQEICYTSPSRKFQTDIDHYSYNKILAGIGTTSVPNKSSIIEALMRWHVHHEYEDVTQTSTNSKPSPIIEYNRQRTNPSEHKSWIARFPRSVAPTLIIPRPQQDPDNLESPSSFHLTSSCLPIPSRN
jgi:hypothetical protein